MFKEKVICRLQIRCMSKIRNSDLSLISDISRLSEQYPDLPEIRVKFRFSLWSHLCRAFRPKQNKTVFSSLTEFIFVCLFGDFCFFGLDCRMRTWSPGITPVPVNAITFDEISKPKKKKS